MIRDLDPRRYTQRTYIISSGDAFSSSKAFEFERNLAGKHGLRFHKEGDGMGRLEVQDKQGVSNDDQVEKTRKLLRTEQSGSAEGGYFEIVTVPRARKIHQPLWSTPQTSFYCFLACIKALLPHTPSSPTASIEAPRRSPDLIITNGPATGVIVVLASLVLRFLGSNVVSRSVGTEGLAGNEGEMRTIYIESWARVKTLSLSGKILQMGLVNRFLVQWEGLKSGRAEYKGVLVE